MTTKLVPPGEIERIVGVRRHHKAHFGRAVSADRTVYILHSRECRGSGTDLRDCRFSVALDKGIVPARWSGFEDAPVILGVHEGLLVPLKTAGWRRP